MMVSLGSAHFVLQRIHEFPVVGQSRKRIMRGLVADLLLSSLSPCDIKTNPDAAYNFPARGP